ncbi:F0F1 ATP synthase subunit B [Pseudonocardia sp. GCM10023141]|uniref:F0F1 ATP synthase subunit B n=1 Tax=Pseudonocardia sp. GCM10023141 TaxID=3252653 RepID=UPI00360E0893
MDLGEWISSVIAFAIMIWVIVRYVLPLVTKMVKDRQEVVQQQVDASEEAAQKLAEAQQRLASALDEARAEAARIRDDARADATRIGEELKEQARLEVERIKARGEEQLAAQRDQAVRVLRAELGTQSMDLAERVVTESLSSDARRGATVDSFLGQLEQMTGNARPAAVAGGTN